VIRPSATFRAEEKKTRKEEEKVGQLKSAKEQLLPKFSTRISLLGKFVSLKK
jgi:hypothetical protein